MRKIYTFLALCLIFIGATSAMAADGRTFKDFEINLVTTSAPTLPEGVTQISYPSYGVNYRNGDNHGTSWYAIQFDVDGPVKITLGGCEYAKDNYQWVDGHIEDAAGNVLCENVGICAAGCKGSASYEYKGGANTLKVYCGEYCPYVKVEKIDASASTPEPTGFKDFTIDLTKNPIATLPEGVTQVSYPQNGASFNGSQHGWQWFAAKFAVDGPVKITIGGCQYINEGYEGYVTDDKGTKLGDLKNKTEKCYHEDGSAATFEYKGGANTLKVYCGEYCPILKVEAIEATDPTVKEKTLYKTRFQDWDAVKASDTETTIKKTTTDGQELTFSLLRTMLDPAGTDGKFTAECITEGYMRCEKKAKDEDPLPYIKTSTLANVTSVKFAHAATGSNRGWGLKVKGDGDADWVTVSDAVADQKGTEVEVNVKRTNVQLWFYNLTPDQYAFLTSLEIKGNVKVEPRNFEDFKVDFRTNPYTVVAPKDGLPNGVTFDGGTFHDKQHGYSNVKMTVPVDGPVKFTIGTSAYTKQATVSIDGGEPTAIETLGSTDDEFGKYTKNVVYTYNEEKAATLTFDLGKYCPYFFAEACDQIPYVSVTYYNTNGKAIGEETVIGNSELKFKYSAADVTVPEGQAFRGWFDGKSTSAKKVKEGIALTEDTKLYAKATPIEVAKLGAIFNYPLNNAAFYPEDHELFNTTGVFHDGQHGFEFKPSQNFSVDVAGNALLVLTTCKYPEGKISTLTVTDAAGKTVGEPITLPVENASDGAVVSIPYNGPATTLTATFSGNEAYIHNVTLYNVSEVPTKKESGYYEVAANDAAALLLTLASAKDGDKIFLPNGTYDLGETVLTTISVNNLSIIGESMDKTIIRNAPDKSTEGIGTTAIFVNTSKNLYLQDLTLRNDLDYYAVGGTARAVCLQDKGENTICKNVKMLSHQDTYYSNKASKFYWEDCELHGCVDYVCGDGDVVFNRSTFVNESRAKNKKSGSDVICAPNTSETINWGYVFLDCKISSLCNDFTLARSWGGKSKAQFIRTQILDNSLASSRFTIEGMNVAADKFKEYATTNSAGTITTPNSNVINFTHSSGNKKYETVLTDAEAAQYTVANIFGEWAPDKIAAQVTDKDKGSIFLVNGKITTDCPTEGKFRIANTRGGFGPEVDASTATAIETVTFPTTMNAPKKFLKDDKIIILKNGKTYNVAGQEMK